MFHSASLRAKLKGVTGRLSTQENLSFFYRHDTRKVGKGRLTPLWKKVLFRSRLAGTAVPRGEHSS